MKAPSPSARKSAPSKSGVSSTKPSNATSSKRSQSTSKPKTSSPTPIKSKPTKSKSPSSLGPRSLHTSANVVTPAQVKGKASPAIERARKALSRVNEIKTEREMDYRMAGADPISGGPMRLFGGGGPFVI